MSGDRYRCNLIIPGAPKSGTTSLHAMLDAHCQIDMSRIKEPHHFAMDARFAAGADAHNALFAASGPAKWYGEASTIYCISDAARERIRDCLHAPKLILLLREPVARLVSHFRWMTRLGHEKRPLQEAVEADGFGFDPERHFGGNYRAYLQFSNYAAFVPQWIRTFGEENVLVLRSEALRTDQVGQLKRCAGFLGIAEFPEVPRIALNATAEAHRRHLPAWITAAARMLPGPVRRNPVIAHLHGLAARLMPARAVPTVTEADVAQLRRLLAEDIAYYDAISDT